MNNNLRQGGISINQFKISIIIPVYNGEKYLPITLDSVINQTIGIENLEIIIANDCSTDNTKQIIEDYKERINNETNKETIKSIHLVENMGGAFGPRNIALNHVNGEYLMFIDSDDTYPLDACETLYNCLWKILEALSREKYHSKVIHSIRRQLKKAICRLP